MATVIIEVTDDGNGGITSKLFGDLSGAFSAARTAAIFVKQQLDQTGVTPCPYCHAEELKCTECGGTGYALLEPGEGARHLMSEIVQDAQQLAAGDINAP
ncbi:hypothetical protein RugamoR64_62080 [Duganella rhizosphaerae]|uniref:hypothetical protein n=1 Tax=Duganella rhizosphaerae TaxID=2885763 RepID=UPI0030E8F7D2